MKFPNHGSVAEKRRCLFFERRASLFAGIAANMPDRFTFHTTQVGTAPRLDLAGIAASTLCALHCLLGPAVLALAPAMGRFWTDPLTHWAIALVVGPVALLAVWRGARIHGRRWLLPPTALAVALIVAALIVPPLLGAGHGHAHHHGDASAAHQLETVLAVAGSALLLAVHAVNLHGCLRGACVRRCDACEQADQARA